MKANYIIFLFFLSVTTHAQLQILTKPGKEEIKIRWVPSTPQEWDMGNRYGYKLVRETLGKNRKPEGKPEVILLKMASQQEWEKLAETNPYAKIPKGYFFDDPILPGELSPEEHKNALAGRMIFVMLSSDLSLEVAQNLGIGYRDTDVKPKQAYKYTVSINHPSASASTASTFASLGDYYIDLPPLKFRDTDYVDSTLTLSWEANPSVQHSAYVVEKSSDGGVSYHRADDAPYFPFSNEEDLSKITYGIKLDTLYKKYRFRVRGVDPFGELSVATPSVEVFAFDSQVPAPDTLRSMFPGPEQIMIAWEFPPEMNVNIKGFNVYRSDGGQEELKKDNLRLVENKSRIYLGSVGIHDQNVVYHIAAVDLRDRETLSPPLLVTVVDSIAPQKVMNLEGEIDSLGIVKICWEAPPDADLFAYDIVRTEGNMTHEFYPVKQVLRGTTMAFDTLTLGKGTFPYVYYKVIPSDNHTNYTEDNDWLKIVRPDVEPPHPPKFSKVAYTDTTLILGFLPSFSDDVEKYYLYKTYPPDTVRSYLKSINPDSLSLGYIDLAADEEVPVRYVLEAVDHSGLSSLDSCNLTFAIPKPFSRPAVKDLTVKYDKNEKQNLLNWKYVSKGRVSEYWIFRQTGGKGEYQKVAALDGNTYTWTDRDITEKTLYSYYVYARWTDNTRSLTDTRINITTK